MLWVNEIKFAYQKDKFIVDNFNCFDKCTCFFAKLSPITLQSTTFLDRPPWWVSFYLFQSPILFNILNLVKVNYLLRCLWIAIVLHCRQKQWSELIVCSFSWQHHPSISITDLCYHNTRVPTFFLWQNSLTFPVFFPFFPDFY